MGKIRLLNDAVIGKIAAGEVVERPAAAVKELVENSLDAGATAVVTEIREGGLDYIRVTDNGSGIDESDIRMAFERHATSKIAREDDLNAIATLGFRGEALASIAAVSKVTVITRTRDRDSGLKIINRGGVIQSIEETACPVGTTMIVTDLFFNTPVRRGFMKKPPAEASAVNDLIAHMILSRPDVSFRHVSNGKTIYHSAGDGQLSSAVHSVYGGEMLRNMRKVNGHAAGMMVDGYVGIGEAARGNRNNECFFINHRVMFSSVLSNALETACRERVMIGKFPVCVLHIGIPYEEVDVNVHPNKLEVRFRHEREVGDALTALVLEALHEKDAFEKPVEMVLTPRRENKPEIPIMKETGSLPPSQPPVRVTVSKMLPPEAMNFEKKEAVQPEFRPVQPGSAETVGTLSAQGQNEKNEPVRETAKPEIKPEIKPELSNQTPNEATTGTITGAATVPDRTGSLVLPEKKLQNMEAVQTEAVLPEIKKKMTVFGALFDTFILVEYEDRLLLIDQHAVHERLLFDRMMQQYGKEVSAQELLIPQIISVTRQEQAVLEENRELLEGIGLVVESFGETDIAVRAIPMMLGEVESTAFVREIIQELESGKTPGFEKKRTMILQTACKHAVKGGEKLTEDVLRDLVETMIAQKVTPTCPHGRPLVVAITHTELDRKFKRIQ